MSIERIKEAVEEGDAGELGSILSNANVECRVLDPATNSEALEVEADQGYYFYDTQAGVEPGWCFRGEWDDPVDDDDMVEHMMELVSFAQAIA